MSLGLAIKRTYRFFDPSLRRWLRRNYNPIGLYLIGLYTGLEVGHTPAHLTWYFDATILAMLGLKWWTRSGTCRECGAPN